MPDHTLRGCRVLVVEDEYMLADDLRAGLQDEEAIVLGPVGRLDRALDLVRAEPRIDGAVLDVNLGGDSVYPVADLLLARDVPVVFTTGYDSSAIPPQYAHVARCEKPLDLARLTQTIGRLIHP